MGRLELTLMGSPQVRMDGEPVTGFRSSKAQALLFYLAVTAQMHTRPALAGLLWGEWPEQSARTSLNQTLSNLRQLVGDHLAITRQTAAFDRESNYWLDVEALQADDVDLAQVLDLLRGELLDGFYVNEAPAFEEWLLRQRVRVREQVLGTLHRLAMEHEVRGEWAEAIAGVRRMLDLEPWREEAHRQLMRLLAQSGQRAAALAQYETCRELLVEELGVEPGAETTALYEQIRTGAYDRDKASDQSPHHPVAQSPDHPVPRSLPHNLPIQTTPFVGREDELAAILKRLRNPACRLLTLVGPGGIGKTRLALQAAQRLVESEFDAHTFPDGIFFVPLAAVSTEDGVVAAIAEAVDFHFYDNARPRQQLLNFLREKQMLLVLDNFEQLLEAVDLLNTVLATAPAVKLIVTSRVALNLREEWFHAMEGLAVPPAEDGAQIDGYDAVRLFVQSARRARLGFSLADEGEHVLRICRLVEGMPLAIELAAAWLKALPAARVAEEIERNLDILTTRQHNVSDRHRSMRVVLEQTWQLLSVEEQDVLKRLSVFRGGFTQDAAEAVAGASLLTLAILVEKSLLRVDAAGRYQIHELTRQYAAEQLAAAPDVEEKTRTQHSLYYLHYVEQQEGALMGRDQKRALQTLGREIDNVRTGWSWALDRGEIHVLERALDGIFHLYQIRGRYQEGRELFAQAIRRCQTSAQSRGRGQTLGKFLARRGAFAFYLGDYNAARSDLQLALAEASELLERAFTLNHLGKIAHVQGRRADAETMLAEALDVSRAATDRTGEAEALYSLSALYSAYAEFEEAKRLGEACLTVSRQLESPHLVAAALHVLAWPVNCLGAYAESERYWRESLAICQEIGNQGNTAIALNYIGWVGWCIGGPKLREGISYCERALAIYRQIGHRTNLASCLGDLALFTAELGEYGKALAYGEEGLSTAQAIGHFDLVPYNLYALGSAACGAGDFETSRRYLLASMKLSLERDVPDHAANALFYLAALITKEYELIDATDPEWLEKADWILTLLQTVIDCPATWQPIRDRAGHLRTVLLSQLPTELAEQVQSSMQARSWDEILAEIVAPLEGS